MTIFMSEVVNDQVSRQPDREVLRVRVGSKDFASDLAGAQYGWQEPVFRWTDYLTDRVANGKTYNPQDFDIYESPVDSDRKSSMTDYHVRNMVTWEVSHEMINAVRAWRRAGHVTFFQLLKLRGASFDEGKQSLLDHVKVKSIAKVRL
ncbi:hypothetical protein LTS18_012959 [Coniosporium uncinatum]|uniref:Uncharacterized protein n=1 Tax=Coniosporium uncinatum TaxID=93489 RepID=A0ACC3DBW1_9PEZI|nr:hypothetical protein LTS18_012959 [Coniosporium uncinatum]